VCVCSCLFHFAFSALTLLVGWQDGHQACKNWVVGCWRGCLLERDADLYMAQLMPRPLTVSCFSKIQVGFTFLVPAHLGSPGKRAIKRVCVCVCVPVSSNSVVKSLRHSIRRTNVSPAKLTPSNIVASVLSKQTVQYHYLAMFAEQCLQVSCSSGCRQATNPQVSASRAATTRLLLIYK